MGRIESVFDNYTSRFLSENDNKAGYADKYNHSYFVMQESLLVDQTFTQYNTSFQELLKIQSLYHDIGRFLQLKLVGSFSDYALSQRLTGICDHGDLGSTIMHDELLRELFPKDNIFDEEIAKVIRLHTKDNKGLLKFIKRELIERFKNYDLRDLFVSQKSGQERTALTAVNTAIIQDADRLDIFRKIVNRIWVPNVSHENIHEQVWSWFYEGNLPSINELKKMGYWNANVGHLIRMNFINQMYLVPELQKIRDEQLIQRVYTVSGNEIVKPAYDFAIEKLDSLIDESEDKILVKKRYTGESIG
ncbi:MAG: HD domain-containing protein [Firmicutes bacterium]|nr:HD domain-containing protein [Bacillota bacterium]